MSDPREYDVTVGLSAAEDLRGAQAAIQRAKEASEWGANPHGLVAPEMIAAEHFRQQEAAMQQRLSGLAGGQAIGEPDTASDLPFGSQPCCCFADAYGNRRIAFHAALEFTSRAGMYRVDAEEVIKASRVFEAYLNGSEA